jgi:sugar (pentulose or hexulose) kinase
VQLLANLINQPLETTDGVSESRGAAIFAAVLIGKYPTIEKAIAHMVQPKQTFNPDIELSRIYQQLFKQWRDHRVKRRTER